MTPDPEIPGDLADAVLDGRVLDWHKLESTADPQYRNAILQFRTIAAIAGISRRITEEPPQWWGHLKIEKRVGAGAFGEVFRAWDSRLERHVALKLLWSDRDPAAILREARLLARIRHPNIVAVFDAAEFDGRAGFWMEFVQGQTLEQSVRERGPLPAREVHRLAIELCRALAAVHAAGLLNRDVKAQNVICTDDGRVVLMDFGSGNELGSAEPVSQQSIGTPLYLAPEVLSGSAATPASEIYSLGVLLFRVATGSYPVSGATIGDLRDLHLRGIRKKLLAVMPEFPADLALVIEKALEPEPTERFESVPAVESALTRRSLVPAFDRRWIARWLVVTAVAVILIVSVAVSWTNRQAGPLMAPVLGNECNQPLPDAITHFRLSGPVDVKTTHDGCWVFVWVNRGEKTSQGVAVLRRMHGTIEQVHFFPTSDAPGHLNLTHDEKVLIVGSTNQIDFVDVKRLKSREKNALLGSMRLDLGGNFEVASTKDDRYLFVRHNTPGLISVVDYQKARTSGFNSSAIVGQISGAVSGDGLLVFSPDGRYLYVSNEGARGKNWPVECPPTARRENTSAPEGPPVSQSMIAVIDVQQAISNPDSAVIATVPGGCSVRRVAISPDGNTIYTIAQKDPGLLAFDAKAVRAGSKSALIGKVPMMGHVPRGIAVIDGGRKVLVANSTTTIIGQSRVEGTLLIIDSSSITSGAAAILARVPAGVDPLNLETTADRNTVFLANRGGTLEILDLGKYGWNH